MFWDLLFTERDTLEFAVGKAVKQPDIYPMVEESYESDKLPSCKVPVTIGGGDYFSSEVVFILVKTKNDDWKITGTEQKDIK